jgi:pyridoxine kinase
MAVLSIQSRVAFGHVGNSAAEFALRRLGHDVWPIDTVRFSNHPGYGQHRGEAAEPGEIVSLLKGIGDLDVWAQCQALLSGYLGSAATGEAILSQWRTVHAAAPEAVFCCDPVLGDAREGLYVADELVAFYRDQALPEADVILPNVFELGLLTGGEAATTEAALTAARIVLQRGPKIVVATSLKFTERNSSEIGTLMVSGDGAWLVRTPEIECRAKGAGDLLAALWLGRYLISGDAVESLSLAVSSVFGLIRAADGGSELPLAAAQQEIVMPSQVFSVDSIT